MLEVTNYKIEIGIKIYSWEMFENPFDQSPPPDDFSYHTPKVDSKPMILRPY